MSDIKLLSCPVCSREVYIGTEDYDDNIEDVIVCDHCNLRFYGSYPATKQDLAEEWNTRKPMERIIERLEERHLNHVNNIFKYQEVKDFDSCSRTSNIKVENEIAIEIVKEEGGIE